MNIHELEKIIDLNDLKTISNTLKKQGFREVGHEGVKEFKSDILQNESEYKKTFIKKFENARKEYYVELYKDNKTYKGFTFIYITLCTIINNLSIPRKGIYLTDAPINPEYIKEINSTRNCDSCGKRYKKKNLIDYDENYYVCMDCLVDITDKELIRLREDEVFKEILND